MPIVIKDPITVPEKKLDKLWASEIHILADFKSKYAQTIIKLLPYNNAGDVGTPCNLVVHDVLAKITANPHGNLAKAYGALLAAIQDEYDSTIQFELTSQE